MKKIYFLFFIYSVSINSQTLNFGEHIENKKITSEVCIHHLSFTNRDFPTKIRESSMKIRYFSTKIRDFSTKFRNLRHH